MCPWTSSRVTLGAWQKVPHPDEVGILRKQASPGMAERADYKELSSYGDGERCGVADGGWGGLGLH